MGLVLRAGRPAKAEVALRPIRAYTKNAPDSDDWALQPVIERFADPTRQSDVATTKTNERGEFSFASLPAGPHVFVATGEDGACAVARAVAGATLVLPTRAHALEGVARFRDGTPAPGFVRAVLPGGPGPWTDTAADGTFDIPGLPEGTVTLQFRAPGEWDVLEPDLHVPHTGRLALIVDARYRGRATGRVVAYEDDRPIAGASVLVRAGKNSARVRTDENGRFDAPAPHTKGSLLIVAAGRAPLATEVRASDAPYPLLRAATTVGRVVRDEDGAAMPGARVEVRDNLGLRTLVSDASGTFTLSDLAPGEIFFLARADDRLPVGARSFSMWPAKSRQRLSVIVRAGASAHAEIRMALRATLAGVVRDEAGAPLSGIDVSTGYTPTENRTVTDGEGRFTLSAPAGDRHWVRCWAAGREKRSVHGNSPFEITLKAADGPCVIVTDTDDAPIAGARVTVAENYKNQPVRLAWTDAAGKAFWEPVGNGVHTLVIEADGFAIHRVSVGNAVEPKRVQLRIGRLARVRTVFADGTPVVGSWIRFKTSMPTTGRTDGNGWLHMGRVPAEPTTRRASPR